MCGNAFLPVDVITFWAVQMFAVCLPTVCFMTYMVHKIGAVEDARKIKEKKGTVEIKSVIHRDPRIKIHQRYGRL